MAKANKEELITSLIFSFLPLSLFLALFLSFSFASSLCFNLGQPRRIHPVLVLTRRRQAGVTPRGQDADGGYVWGEDRGRLKKLEQQEVVSGTTQEKYIVERLDDFDEFIWK